jgi:hypothetical protein
MCKTNLKRITDGRGEIFNMIANTAKNFLFVKKGISSWDFFLREFCIVEMPM